MKLKKRYLILITLAIALIISFLVFKTSFDFSNKNRFEVDNIILKVLVKEGDSLTKTMRIKNTYPEKGNFEVNANSDFILIKDKKFGLNPEETKFLSINFDAKNPGVYSGKLAISDGNSRTEIPIILEVETKEIFFDSILTAPLDYSNVYLGEKLVIDVKWFNLEKIGAKEVRISYVLSDFNGKIIFSESENLVIEEQILNTKIMPIPKDISPGDYLLAVIAEYKDSVGTGSYFFKIKKKEFDIFSNSKYTAIIALVSFFLILSFLVYYIWYRDKLLIELYNLYKQEIKNQKELIKYQEKRNLPRLKSTAEREFYEKELKKIKKKRIDFIKNVHKKRIKEYERIKRRKNGDELKNQVKKWKSKGYDTSILDKKFGFPSTMEIREKIKKWKRQRYDTNILEKR